MKFSTMKIGCPVCQSKITKVRKDHVYYWTECPNQCAKLKYRLSGEMISYLVRVHIDDKDYRFCSQPSCSFLDIYKQNPETQKWEFKQIMQLNKFTDFEEVANNPWRFVQRLLNVKVFA